LITFPPDPRYVPAAAADHAKYVFYIWKNGTYAEM
jgi:hypothetical protein